MEQKPSLSDLRKFGTQCPAPDTGRSLCMPVTATTDKAQTTVKDPSYDT